MRAVFVALQEGSKALRRVPAVEGMTKVLGTAQIAEPDAALVASCRKKGRPLDEKANGNTISSAMAPSSRRATGLGRGPEATAVALGLLQRRRHIDVLAFGFHDRDGRQSNEQHVVGRVRCAWAIRRSRGSVPSGRAPLANVSCAESAVQPAARKLLVDELAGVAFAELYDGRRRIGGRHELGNDLGRLGNGLRLKRLQPLQEFGLRRLGLGSHCFPEGPVILGLSDLCLNLVEHLSRILMRGAILRQFGAKHIEFSLELGTFVCRGSGRLERTRLERRVLEGPVKPYAELPSEPKAQQRCAMVPCQSMVRVVACLAHLGKQPADFAWNDALVLQSPEQIDLHFSRRGEEPYVRGGELGEQFSQLAKLQEASVRVILKVALGEHPKTHELLVVRLEMSKVR